MGMADLILCRFMNVHLLDLLDGSPHKTPLKKVLQLNLGQNRGFLLNAQIGSSRIALVVGFLGSNQEGSRRELIAWDWRTGEVVGALSACETCLNQTSIQVLEHSSADLGAISGISAMRFLEGSLLVALSDRGSDPQLLVFDTLLPQQGPENWRILQLPRLPRHTFYMVPAQHGNPPAERPEFLVDPAQRNFVVQSYRGPALVIPVELFIRVVHSPRADSCIRWEDWEKHIMKLDPHPDTVAVQLVDAKALALRTSPPYPEGWGVEVYDLSKSGQKDVQVQEAGEGQDKGCMKILSTPQWFDRLQLGTASSTFLVGSKVVCLPVSMCIQTWSYDIHSCITQSGSPPPGEEYRLRIWKIG